MSEGKVILVDGNTAVYQGRQKVYTIRVGETYRGTSKEELGRESTVVALEPATEYRAAIVYHKLANGRSKLSHGYIRDYVGRFDVPFEERKEEPKELVVLPEVMSDMGRRLTVVENELAVTRGAIRKLSDELLVTYGQIRELTTQLSRLRKELGCSDGA